MNKYISGFLMLFIPILSYGQCDIVARVFDASICQTDIEINIRPGAMPLSPERQLKVEKMRLSEKIRAIAAEHILAKGSYLPDNDEIDVYIEFSEKAEANRDKNNAELIATIEHLLKTYRYSDSNRKRLEKSLATFRKSEKQSKQIKSMLKQREEDMKKKLGDDAVKEFNVNMKNSRHEIAVQWVARWKMNKALYNQYGGRVIFQQAGVEPIDAYRAFLKDIRSKGALKILNTKYTDVFKEFEHYLDMKHNYLGKKGEEYFAQPYWVKANLDDAHQKAINEYQRIPHL